jgi:hypothetical protein
MKRKPFHLIARNPVFQAFSRRPMSKELQATQCIDARMAYTAIVNGAGTSDDRETLAGVVNCVAILAEKHCSPADIEIAEQSHWAMMRADGRALEGKAWNFDGTGRTAMLAALELFEDMAARMGQGAIADALLTVIERVAKGQVHGVGVA